MNNVFCRTLAVVASLIASTQAVLAADAVPRVIAQVGRFTDSKGNPPGAATLTVTFALYDAQGGGTPRWSETKPVALDSGFYVTRLGDTTAFPQGLWSGATLFLGIKVTGDDEELKPRQVIDSVPFALRAAEAVDAVGDIHPKSITSAGKIVVADKVVVNDKGEVVGPVAPRGPGTVARFDRFTAEQKITADLAVIGNVWKVTGTELAPPMRLPQAARVELFASGSVRGVPPPPPPCMVAPCPAPPVTGYCGFRFSVKAATAATWMPQGNPNWGDRIIGCDANKWCDWSIYREIMLGPGDWEVRVEQVGHPMTPMSGCLTAVGPHSWIKLRARAYY